MSADDDELRLAAHLDGQRTGPVDGSGAGGLPAVDPRGRIDAEQVRTAPVVYLHDQQSAKQQRRGRHAPAVAERPVLLRQRAYPHRATIEIDTHKVAGAEQGIDAFAVGCRRGHGHAARRKLSLGSRRTEEGRPPQMSAVVRLIAVQVQAVAESAARAGQEDAVAPDDRRTRRRPRATPLSSGCFPCRSSVPAGSCRR